MLQKSGKVFVHELRKRGVLWKLADFVPQSTVPLVNVVQTGIKLVNYAVVSLVALKNDLLSIGGL